MKDDQKYCADILEAERLYQELIQVEENVEVEDYQGRLDEYKKYCEFFQGIDHPRINFRLYYYLRGLYYDAQSDYVAAEASFESALQYRESSEANMYINDIQLQFHLLKAYCHQGNVGNERVLDLFLYRARKR